MVHVVYTNRKQNQLKDAQWEQSIRVEIKTLYYCYTQSRKPESCGEDPESSYLADGKCYYARIDLKQHIHVLTTWSPTREIVMQSRQN